MRPRRTSSDSTTNNFSVLGSIMPFLEMVSDAQKIQFAGFIGCLPKAYLMLDIRTTRRDYGLLPSSFPATIPSYGGRDVTLPISLPHQGVCNDPQKAKSDAYSTL